MLVRIGSVLTAAFGCCFSIMYAQANYPAPPTEVVAAAVRSFAEYDTGTSADAILAQGGSAGSSPDQPVVLTRSFDPGPGGGVFGATKPTYPSAHITSLMSRSDFAGVGTPVANWSYPLPNHSFAVTVYLVNVNRVGVPGKEAISTGSTIYIAQAGGQFTINGRSFRAIDTNFQPFRLNEPYLFFGTMLGPHLFKVDSEQVLKTNGESVSEISLRHQYAGFYSSTSVETVLQEAIAAAVQNSIAVGTQR